MNTQKRRLPDAQVSIVIPTLNEGLALPSTLESLAMLDPAALEVIVVDADSADDTRRVALAHGASVLHSTIRRRSHQLDLGARAARGEVLAFVHADTQLPRDALTHMRSTLADSRIALAGFTSVMRGTRIQQLTTFHNWIKTYYAPLLYRPLAGLFKGLRLLFGDQAMFCRREDYLRVGGFDREMDIMEEADLCLKLNRLGAIRQLRTRVYSSDRRVARFGVVRSNLLFIAIALGWGYGVSPIRLRRLFERM